MFRLGQNSCVVLLLASMYRLSLCLPCVVFSCRLLQPRSLHWYLELCAQRFCGPRSYLGGTSIFRRTDSRGCRFHTFTYENQFSPNSPILSRHDRRYLCRSQDALRLADLAFVTECRSGFEYGFFSIFLLSLSTMGCLNRQLLGRTAST